MERNITGLDSLVVFRNSQGNEARGTLIHITRHLVVFEVYNPYSVVQLSEVLAELRIMRGDRIIYTGRAVVSNLVTTGVMLIVSATLVDPWKDLAGLAPGHGVREEVERFVKDFEVSHTLRPSYQLVVSSIRSFLGEMSRWLGQLEAATGVDGPNMEPEVRAEYFEEICQPVAPKVDELFGKFEEEASRLGPEEVVTHKAFARRELHPLMLCAPFLHRTFTKPLGYAGDYEMVNMIIGNSTVAANNTYAKLVNAYYLNAAPSRAHRNRIDILADHLRDEARRAVAAGRTLRVLNIGCGPAVEMQRFIRSDELCEKCEFHLVDFNAETLDYARNRLNEAASDGARTLNITYIHKSINELLKEAARRDSAAAGPFDFVYCAGLFDYLSDRICTRLVQLFYDWTTPGGAVLVTNVDPSNPIRLAMEHIVEWNLIYRTEKQLAVMADGLRGEARSFSDATGVNVFLTIRKAGP